MAQNQFVNITADGNTAKRTDISDARHGCSNGPSASGDMTLSWDAAKFTTLSQVRGAIQTIMAQLRSQLPP